MMSVAYQAHPTKSDYRLMNYLENMRVDDIQEWYDRWYAPNNAILVIVGDVDAEECISLRKIRHDLLRPVLTSMNGPQLEPPQLGTKRIIVKAPAELPYRIMVTTHNDQNVQEDWEPYALEI